MAAPVLVAAVTGSDARSTVSKEYGGKSTDEAAAKANPVYNAIGQVRLQYSHPAQSGYFAHVETTYSKESVGRTLLLPGVPLMATALL